MTRDVVVVGSINMDLVARAPRLPIPGETLSGSSFATSPGGKGANQAVAASRLGAGTAMIGCLGQDAFGAVLRPLLEQDGVDTGAVRAVAGSTGVALVVVDEAGRNGIVVVPGANAELSPADVDRNGSLISGARVVALQLETPLPTVLYAAERARGEGKTVVLNPAPAQPLPSRLLACADYLVPNEIEAAMLTGQEVGELESAARAAEALRAMGARNVIITLGERGVVWATPQGTRHVPAPRVKAVDTTAAGDTFIGGLCAALVAGKDLASAVGFAQAAAALSVTRVGAQPSIPYEREVETCCLPGESAL
ncbi:MAG TPA: ribokinase [Anaeromyxobacteraceae bacterium]|nr:ribokinase [Anaeromyxobacteraceae bacterium]